MSEKNVLQVHFDQELNETISDISPIINSTRKISTSSSIPTFSKLKSAIANRRSVDEIQSVLSTNKYIGEFFEKLSDLSWVSIKMNCSMKIFKKGENVFGFNNSSDNINFIMSGSIGMYKLFKNATRNFAPKRHVHIYDDNYMELFRLVNAGQVEGDLRVYNNHAPLMKGICYTNECRILT